MKREISHQQEPEESQGLVDGVKDFERERMQAWLKAELQKERKKEPRDGILAFQGSCYIK